MSQQTAKATGMEMTRFVPDEQLPLTALSAEMVRRVFGVSLELKAHSEGDPGQPWKLFNPDRDELDVEALLVAWRCGMAQLAVVVMMSDRSKFTFIARPNPWPLILDAEG